MKRLQIVTLIIIVLTMSVFMGCSRNKSITQEKEQEGFPLKMVSKTTYTVFNLPAWIVFFPEGETAISIIPETGKKKSVLEADAKLFSARALSKNNSSFLFDSLSGLRESKQPQVDLDKLKIEDVIAYDLEAAKDMEESMHILAETNIPGYRIYLVSKGNPDFNADIIRYSADRTPDWCKSQETTEDEQNVFVVGYGEAAVLSDAWQTAHDKALKKLAYYRSFNDLESNANFDAHAMEEYMQNKLSKPAGAAFSKTWFFQKVVNGTPTYHTFIMLKAPKLLQK